MPNPGPILLRHETTVDIVVLKFTSSNARSMLPVNISRRYRKKKLTTFDTVLECTFLPSILTSSTEFGFRLDEIVLFDICFFSLSQFANSCFFKLLIPFLKSGWRWQEINFGSTLWLLKKSEIICLE